MQDFLNNPLVQTALFPLLVSTALAALLGFSSKHTAKLASIAVAISIVLSIILIAGWNFPPKSSSQKLPFIVAAAGLLGVIFDNFNWRGARYKLACLAIPLATLAWLFAARAGSVDLVDGLYLLFITLLTGLFLQRAQADRERLDSGIKILLLLAGLGGLLLIGSSAMLTQLAFASMAAVGGFLLLNWPVLRFQLACSLLFPASALISALAAQSLFFTKASGLGLTILVGLLFIDTLTTKLPYLKRLTSPVTKPFALTACGLVILLVAVGCAQLLSEPSHSGY